MSEGALLPISLLIVTYNEAQNIARCLDSVPFAQEKLVIDCGSTDATVAIARARGARVVQQPWLGFGLQRRAATALASHPWILFLDADEWLSAELAAELALRLPELLRSEHAGAYVRRCAWFMGARMRWYRPLARERIERLYHRDRAQWSDAAVHEALHFGRSAIELRAPLLHAYTPSLTQRVFKDIYYAELRARERHARGRGGQLWSVPFVFAATFFKDYVLRLAVLDGGRGFVAAQLAASYAVYKRLRGYEMRIHPESIELARDALRRHGFERGES
ncbi:MAG TPA: glycosyltransferase family 2 protein [Steroidobacteraceae bacterium]